MSRRLLQVFVSISAIQAMLGGGLYLWFGVAGLSIGAASPLAIDVTDPAWSRVDYMYRYVPGIEDGKRAYSAVRQFIESTALHTEASRAIS